MRANPYSAWPMTNLEFYFDCSSPWTYLAFENIQPIAERFRQPITWRPILVGGVFNEINPGVYEARAKPVPEKARYYAKDLQDWAELANIRIGSPPVFPVNSVKAMRGALVAMTQDCVVTYARRVFQAYWGELQDISQEHVLRRIAADCGLEVERFMLEIQERRYKDALRANTRELMERGGFGSPTMYVNGADMYFGNDRLPLVEAALAGLQGRT